ncbi:hypothetical protein [Flocculibacter collagenilyticus]|uniref:hypothetical protein n=1 Tax=Flocculibacter collagenilyticus TaxID=2744479 RepID=UPI0018F3CBF3|nr:hypothetical protein [Flocculibacter collagenilyticus]
MNVSAAPNEIMITGKIKSVSTEDDKTTVTLEVTKADSLFGPCFAEQGQAISCFTYNSSKTLEKNDMITAKAEYIGGPDRGVYQLLEIE